MLDLELFDSGTVRDDVLKDLAQGGYIPLTIAQFMEQTALSFFRSHIKFPVKGPACDHNAQRIVEHDEGFADRIHDGFFEGTMLLGAGHWIFPQPPTV